jgi:hypothetical protein
MMTAVLVPAFPASSMTSMTCGVGTHTMIVSGAVGHSATER